MLLKHITPHEDGGYLVAILEDNCIVTVAIEDTIANAHQWANMTMRGRLWERGLEPADWWERTNRRAS